MYSEGLQCRHEVAAWRKRTDLNLLLNAKLLVIMSFPRSGCCSDCWLRSLSSGGVQIAASQKPPKRKMPSVDLWELWPDCNSLLLSDVGAALIRRDAIRVRVRLLPGSRLGKRTLTSDTVLSVTGDAAWVDILLFFFFSQRQNPETQPER